MNNTTIHLISKTGISPNNYMYWDSKEACDSWFLGKSKHEVSEYMYVRADSTSRHGYNAACVHLDIPYNEVTSCDYVSFKNKEYEDRWFHCQVVSREYVNEKTCRIHFVIDFVATYWDSIELGKCLVERTHVTDDWKSEPSRSASKYLLSEPIGVEIRHRPELLGNDPFDLANFLLNPFEGIYNLVTTVDENGDFNKPKINFQSGTPIGGYVYTGTPDVIMKKLEKYITFSNQVIVRQDSILGYVSDVYVSPLSVIEEKPSPASLPAQGDFSSIIKGHYQPKHAKVLDYIRLRLVGNTNDIIMSPAEYDSTLKADIILTGGPIGCFTVLIKDKEGNYNGQATSTRTWPSVPFAGTAMKNQYDLNDVVKGLYNDLSNNVFNSEAVKKQMGNSAGDAALNFLNSRG